MGINDLSIQEWLAIQTTMLWCILILIGARK